MDKSLSLTIFASTGTSVNKKTWAPPDLDRNTTNGNFKLLILLINFLWSNPAYESISMQPHLHLFSSVIGIIPKLGSLPC